MFGGWDTIILLFLVFGSKANWIRLFYRVFGAKWDMKHLSYPMFNASPDRIVWRIK